MTRMTADELHQARVWADTLKPYPVKAGFLGLLDEIERLRRDLDRHSTLDVVATKLRADVHQERADWLHIALAKIRDQVDQYLDESRKIENGPQRLGDTQAFRDLFQQANDRNRA